jgi:hypothetical protein
MLIGYTEDRQFEYPGGILPIQDALKDTFRFGDFESGWIRLFLFYPEPFCAVDVKTGMSQTPVTHTLWGIDEDLY